MIGDDEKSIAEFGLAEAERKESALRLREATVEGLEANVIPKWWIALALVLCGLCVYFTSIDVLLLFAGHKTTGTIGRDGGYQFPIFGKFHRVYYDFVVEGQKYEAHVNYSCGRGLSTSNCVQARPLVIIDYVSWNPAINKAYYDPYSQ